MSKSAATVAGMFALFYGVWCGTGVAQNKKADQQNSADSIRLIDSIQGPNLYQAYCAVCHGANAKGGGPMAPFLKTAPSDLTRISSRNGGMFPRTRVRRIIAGEDSLAGGHGTRQMPIWGPIFSQVAW